MHACKAARNRLGWSGLEAYHQWTLTACWHLTLALPPWSDLTYTTLLVFQAVRQGSQGPDWLERFGGAAVHQAVVWKQPQSRHLELQDSTLDKKHVVEMQAEAAKHRRLPGLKKQGTWRLPRRMRHAVHDAVWEVYLDPSTQEATQPAASEPAPSCAPPAKHTKRVKTEQAAEPTHPMKGTRSSKGKAAKVQPAPPPGRWVDRDCNAALNMQRNRESMWRPLELCWWPDLSELPAKGTEYPCLGYKRRPPKAQQQHHVAQLLVEGAEGVEEVGATTVVAVSVAGALDEAVGAVEARLKLQERLEPQIHTHESTWTALVELELAAERAAFEERINNTPDHKLQAQGLVLLGVKAQETFADPTGSGQTLGRLNLPASAQSRRHNFVPGDFVLIRSTDYYRAQGGRWEGIIMDISSGSMRLQLYEQATDAVLEPGKEKGLNNWPADELARGLHVRVDKGFNRVSYDRQLDALQMLMACQDTIAPGPPAAFRLDELEQYNLTATWVRDVLVAPVHCTTKSLASQPSFLHCPYNNGMGDFREEVDATACAMYIIACPHSLMQ
ncbi:hypothetical protein QJQ45_007223 [Haematococcus lacustris]|nr:hypothetical protein QJQ45_007223 [Haematococcus lacustris]